MSASTEIEISKEKFQSANKDRFDSFVDEAFFQKYFHSGVWMHTYWMGKNVLKCPLDLWAYQEIIHENQPDVIIETGSGPGATAHFLASVCDVIGRGRVISVDIEHKERPSHKRLSYLKGDSVDKRTFLDVANCISDGERVMAILDSDHSAEHVLKEMENYGALVTAGQYLIVEDTCLYAGGNGGPRQAVEMFLLHNKGFNVDLNRHKFFMTFNPYGYLQKMEE